MIRFVGLVCVLVCCPAMAQDKPKDAKPIHEARFIRELQSMRQKLNAAGTSAAKSLQFDRFEEDFRSKFQAFDLELDGTVTEVIWTERGTLIRFSSVIPGQSFKNSGITSVSRVLTCEIDQEAAAAIRKGTKVNCVVRLVWIEEAKYLIASPSPRVLYRYVVVHGSERIEGRFAIAKYDAKVGKLSLAYTATKED